ncbi:MAG TPA: bifunctional phosphopantothenoylcysteine decarboxylase/phosphopantothenate--cysteine ligase CoaBC [Candidatus Acidoferrales bacterium]|nr:bifunctional phosphopantothenoylcysteine decarboxylase/phosphopantothenate--cysteine ligase CoaBC [Candidatus Acidoferrales bacterium]
MDRMTDARILIGVCGGIAAYKIAGLTSTLVQRGATVDVIMTAEAERFVGALTFASLTARPVYTSLWDAPERIPHIRLVREAQVMLIAPATANTIAKLAQGFADDLVTAAALAARIPVIVAPAMNAAMYEHEATQAHLRTLRERGCEIVDPERGFLAERESGVGRLASEEVLLETLDRVRARARRLAGTRVLITAGPTREAFDPIRFVSNASTGATGIAIAREAAMRGADVTLLLGPTLLEPPAGVTTHRFTTANDLLELARTHGARADLVIATAAVADWRPAQRAASKLKKGDDDLVVEMVRNPDVLAELAERNDEAFLVGFAAETDDHETNARGKLVRKGLSAIVVNDVRDERGFGLGDNALTVLWKDGRKELGSGSKAALAARLLDTIEELR